MDLEEFTNLKKKLDKYRKEADMSLGARNKLLEQLKEEFACNDLQEAEVKAKSLQGKLDKTKKQREDSWKTWYEEYGAKLEE